MNFFLELVAVIALVILGHAFSRRTSLDLYGGIAAVGTLGIFGGAVLLFFGWLASRSAWLRQTQFLFWIGLGVLFIGLLFIEAASFFRPVGPKQSGAVEDGRDPDRAS